MATFELTNCFSCCKAAARWAPIRPASTRALAEAGSCRTGSPASPSAPINAAIIAGNPPERRVERLRAFWELVVQPSARQAGRQRRPFTQDLQRGERRAVAPSAACPASSSRACRPPCSCRRARRRRSASTTRRRCGDARRAGRFRSSQRRHVRLSVGAVQVRTGNMQFFDTAAQTIRPEHIMASGALPPGFPPVEIDGEPYWDGGLVSNTPLQYVLDWSGQRRRHVRLPDRSVQRPGPHAGDPVRRRAAREGHPLFQPHAAQHRFFREMQTIRRAIRHLGRRCPQTSRTSPTGSCSSAFACDAAITIVHLIHRRAVYSTQSNDYEFSRYYHR